VVNSLKGKTSPRRHGGHGEKYKLLWTETGASEKIGKALV
jgi:hypothetical protein